MSVERTIFRRASTTYYWSSVFFPGAVRDDVFRLYSFVRVVDDLVDAMPQDTAAFDAMARSWRSGRVDETLSDVQRVALQNMLGLQKSYDIPNAWVETFLRSMAWDTTQHKYQTIGDSLDYVYGSAEVIGLMMARILGLPEDALEAARLQGRAMQWINFCRDVQEDVGLGRCYFPAQDLKRFGLDGLSHDETQENVQGFLDFMRYQLQRYRQWQAQADEGYQYIPRRMRIPVRTAADMYNWTAQQIADDPWLVYRRTVKPSRYRVMTAALKSLVRS